MTLFGGKKEKVVDKVNFHNTEQIEEELHKFCLEDLPHSTTLMPHELYLLRKSGYEPLQVVFGNVVFSMGAGGFLRTVLRAFSRGEMVDFSRLNKDARELARNRMIAEAKNFGADGVVGVRIDTREYMDFIEVIATGTAVKKCQPLEGDKELEVAVGA